MIIVNIFEAKARLSEYIEAMARGERVFICKRNRPVAELRPVESARTDPRPIGKAKGLVRVPDSFFEPLPDEVVEAFYGDETGSRAAKVAEPPPAGAYGPRPRRRKGRPR